MVKVMAYILLCLFILSCSYKSSTYNHSLRYTDKSIDKLQSQNKAIIVFGDEVYGNFINLNSVKDSILIEVIDRENNKSNIVKVNPGRYILDAGLFKRTPKKCFSSLMRDIAIMMFIPGAVFGMTEPGDKFIEPTIKSKTPAVFYFDVNPGEISYIGNVSSRFIMCDIVLTNDFKYVVKDIKKDYPDIASNLKVKFLKIAKKPESCNFLIDDINNLDNEEKYNKIYKTCLTELKLLP